MLRIVFAGTPEFALPALKTLIESEHEVIAVYTQPDRPAGRGRQLRASPVKHLAQIHQLPVYQPETLRHLEAQRELEKLKPDLMIVVAYGLLLPEAILKLPKFGCINIHASLLPRWRGAAPIQRALEAGDQETGLTLMQMDKGLDKGAMLYKAFCPIRVEDNAQDLQDRLAALQPGALRETLKLLETGSLQPEIQDESLVTYAAKLTKAEAEIVWQETAVTLARRIRAFNPFPVTYSYLQNQLIKIWQAELVEEKHQVKPGTILRSDAQGIVVATGAYGLRLTKIQLAGGKPLAVKEILHARQQLFAAGQCFAHEC